MADDQTGSAGSTQTAPSPAKASPAASSPPASTTPVPDVPDTVTEGGSHPETAPDYVAPVAETESGPKSTLRVFDVHADAFDAHLGEDDEARVVTVYWYPTQVDEADVEDILEQAASAGVNIVREES